MVRAAYRRCGLPYTRVHLLRHTLARRVLAEGGTLKEIADLLRHRALDTSLIYTKVDGARLVAVAQPWPGKRADDRDSLRYRRRWPSDIWRSVAASVSRCASPGHQLLQFAQYADARGHAGPLTLELQLAWARTHGRKHAPISCARRLEIVRPFARYYRQYEPQTAVPDARALGRAHRRLVPHIYTEREITDLLAEAERLTPAAGLRPATYQTLFGLIAATGLRLSEALLMRDVDVDLSRGALTVRQTKFTKSRWLPLHASTVTALGAYRQRRDHVRHGEPMATFSLSPLAAPSFRRARCTLAFAQLRARLGASPRSPAAATRSHGFTISDTRLRSATCSTGTNTLRLAKASTMGCSGFPRTWVTRISDGRIGISPASRSCWPSSGRDSSSSPTPGRWPMRNVPTTPSFCRVGAGVLYRLLSPSAGTEPMYGGRVPRCACSRSSSASRRSTWGKPPTAPPTGGHHSFPSPRLPGALGAGAE